MTDTDRTKNDGTAGVKDTTNRVTETARERADRIADAASSGAADATRAVKTGADRVGDATSRAAGQTTAAVGDVLHDVRDSATDVADTVAAQATAAVANAREVADEGVAYVKARYRENPGLVIAVGAAAIVAVGLLVKAVTRR